MIQTVTGTLTTESLLPLCAGLHGSVNYLTLSLVFSTASKSYNNNVTVYNMCCYLSCMGTLRLDWTRMLTVTNLYTYNMLTFLKLLYCWLSISKKYVQ